MKREEIQKRLKEIDEEKKDLQKELEEINKTYDNDFFKKMKEENPGLWYRWNWQENDFFHFTGFSCMYDDLIRPVKRYTFEIDRRISILKNDDDYLKLTVDSNKDVFTFDEGEFVPVSIEEIISIVNETQTSQMKKIK